MKLIHVDADDNYTVVMSAVEWRVITGTSSAIEPRIGNEMDVRDASAVAASANRLRDVIDREFPRK